jgi:hypothetical protein
VLSAGAAAGGALELRAARRADLDALVGLLLRREGTERDEAAARRTLQDLDPTRCIAWLAAAGGDPVGLSTVLVRTVAAGPRSWRAGYWCALYVDPAFRQRMVYPILPRAMHRAVAAGGLDFVYAAVRIPWLVTAHERIGLVRLGDLPVLAKPLAPVALLARHRGLGGAVEAAGWPIDRAAAAYHRLRRAGALAGHAVAPLAWDGPGLLEVAPLWERAAAGWIGQPWTAELLRRRYGEPGAGYTLLAVRRRGRLLAAAVVRVVERERLRLGVVLDAVADDPGDDAAYRAALAAAEGHAHARGCQAVLALDGPGILPAGTLRGAGYLATPERYTFLVWPCGEAGPGSPLRDLPRWRFGFGDHDAF